MSFSSWMTPLVAGSSLLTLQPAIAADFVLNGTISHQTDVVNIDVVVPGPSANVRFFTDSHQGGLNFDPTLTLWDGTTGSRIAEAQDINSLRNLFDAVMPLSALPGGSYLLTLTAFPNSSIGATLADGFLFGAAEPIELVDWCQPAAVLGCGAGAAWRVHLEGVTSAQVRVLSTPVPEPGAALLLLAGLAGLAAAVRRQSQ